MPNRYLPTSPHDPDQIAQDFMHALEVGIEKERLQDIARLVDDRYGNYTNGRRTLLSQMGEIFKQYDVHALQLRILHVTPYRGELNVRVDWTLRWQCNSVNADVGCPEEKEGKIMVRGGITTFELVQSGMRWVMVQQSGSVLLGLFKPGDAVDLGG